MNTIMIGLDVAKSVFQVHGIDAAGTVTVQRQLRRGQVERFFAGLAPCIVGLEACGGAHHWARLLQRLGHEVRMMPAHYVKPYVKRNKTDGRDAEASLIYAIIGGTDYLDGMAARITGQFSRLGVLLDPIVDRLLVISGVIVCWHFELLPRWALAVLVARELFMLVISQIALAKHVVALGQGGDVTGPGAQLFADNCAACHGDTGKGDQSMGAPNLTDAIWLYGSSEADIAAQIRAHKDGLIALLSAAAPAAAGTLEIAPAPPAQDYVLSFAQQRLWFLDHFQSAAASYNMPMALRLRGRLDAAALQRTLDTIVQRHAILRTTYREIDGVPYQIIHPPVAVPVRRADGPDGDWLQAQLDTERHHVFDLEAGRPVARLVPIGNPPGKRVLGRLEGRLKVPRDFDASLPDDVLAAFEER